MERNHESISTNPTESQQSPQPQKKKRTINEINSFCDAMIEFHLGQKTICQERVTMLEKECDDFMIKLKVLCSQVQTMGATRARAAMARLARARRREEGMIARSKFWVEHHQDQLDMWKRLQAGEDDVTFCLRKLYGEEI